MARVTVSCTITPEQSAFANEKGFNLSSILQDHLNKAMESNINPETFMEKVEECETLRRNMNIWRDKALNCADMLRKYGHNEDVDKIF